MKLCRSNRAAPLLWLTVVLGWVSSGRGADESAPGDQFFGTDKVIRLQLAMTEKQFAAMAPSGGGFGPPGFGAPRAADDGQHRNTFGVAFPWSQMDLTWNGQTFKEVGVRYKGNYTHMATARALKKSLKIDLNRHVKGQKLDGLTMLNAHCGVSDPTKSRESLSYALFRELGVPAPRTVFAEVTLTIPGKYDNEYVGVYTITEQVNKTFLKRHFQDGKGMLLKPEGLQGGPTHLGDEWKPYAARYKPDEDPTDDEKRRLIGLTDLISRADDERFAREIGDYLDLEAFLRFIAANALLSNLDSYLGFGHNYYLYLVPSTNKFVFIPWDLDLSLATWPAVGTPEQLVELSIHHPYAGQDKLLDRLFAIREHKERYLAMVRELLDTKFTRDMFMAQFAKIEQALKEPLEREAAAVKNRQENQGGGGGRGGFGMGFGNGQFGQNMPPNRFIDKRLASVKAQLAGESKGFEPKPFGAGGGRPGGGFGGGGFGGPGRGPGGPGAKPGAPGAKPGGAGGPSGPGGPDGPGAKPGVRPFGPGNPAGTSPAAKPQE